MVDTAKIGRILQLTGGVFSPEVREQNLLLQRERAETERAEQEAILESKRQAREFIQENLQRLPQNDPRRSTFEQNLERLNREISQFGGEALPPAVSEVETPEQLTIEARAKETGKLEARRENIDKILSGVQDSVGEGTVLREGQLDIFSGEKAASDDAQRVTRLFNQASKLAQAGETSQANTLLSQARFLADNSPDIQRAEELNKPISRELASQLGVPVGTTLGEVQEAVIPSPEELAEQRAIGTATGRSEVENRQQLGFINEAEGTIDNLLAEIEQDPGVVGVRGSLRRTGKTALGILSDLGADDLFQTARDLAASASDLPRDEFQTLFDSPTLSTLKLIENSVGLILARMRTPTGRIPVDVIRRSIDDVKLSGLQSSQQVKDRLEFIKTILEGRRQSIQGVTDQQPDLPRFRVNENGELERVE